MHRRIFALALALAVLGACAEQSDPASPFASRLSLNPARSPAAELYRIEALAAGTPWGEIGFPDVLVEIDGRFYVPHLAVIESARENRKVAKLLLPGQSCWLGAHRAAGSATWTWVPPGGAWGSDTFTNWSKNSPRDRGDDEPDPAGSVLALQADGRWRADVDATGTCFVLELKPLPDD